MRTSNLALWKHRRLEYWHSPVKDYHHCRSIGTKHRDVFQVATKVTFNHRQPNALRSFNNELAKEGRKRRRGWRDPTGGGGGNPPQFRNPEHKMGECGSLKSCVLRRYTKHSPSLFPQSDNPVGKLVGCTSGWAVEFMVSWLSLRLAGWLYMVSQLILRLVGWV